MIDELHNLLGGRGDRRREFLNLLRFLGNELRIPLVGVGTREAYLAIRSDDQLENRFAPFTLPRGSPAPRPARCWPASPRRSRCAGLPAIATTEMASYLLTRSEGTIGELAAAAHRRGGGRDRVRRGGHQPAHFAARPVRGAIRAAAGVRARAGVTRPRRWPLHPQPAAARVAVVMAGANRPPYRLTVSDLLTRNLGQADAVAPEAPRLGPACLDAGRACRAHRHQPRAAARR